MSILLNLAYKNTQFSLLSKIKSQKNEGVKLRTDFFAGFINFAHVLPVPIMNNFFGDGF